MNKEKLKELYIKYGLSKDDVYKHQHYVIITRSGIEKIQAIADIAVNFEAKVLEKDFAVMKATAYVDAKQVVETFGSALKGSTYKDGNCNTWYVAEMAEKRALSRVVLKVTGFYQLGVFGEDESEDFKKSKYDSKEKIQTLINK
tara:strand:- start:16 stop:447 length:432 start_codon:yes stop_codon:yes gene_type:complete